MKRLLSVLTAVFLVSLLLAGCSGSSSSPVPSKNSYVGTQTSGDFWTLSTTTIAGVETYTATDAVTGYTYSGNVTALSGNATGFSENTLTSSTDPAASADLSAFTGYGIVIPGTLVMTVPGPFYTLDNGDGIEYTGSYNPPIIAIDQGSCPTAGGTFNWIFVPPSTWCSGDDSNGTCPAGTTVGAAFGTATITVSGSSYNMTVQPYFLDGTADSPAKPLVGSLTGGTCSNGVISGTDSNGNSLSISFTLSGMFFIDLPSGMGSIVGAQVLASPVGNFTTILQSGNTFVGWNFTSFKSINNDTLSTAYAGPMTEPVMSTSSDGTTFTGTPFTDLPSGTLQTSQGAAATFTYADENVSPGLIHAKETNTQGDTHNVYFVVTQINGKYYFFNVTDHWNVNNSGPDTGVDEMSGKNAFVIQQ